MANRPALENRVREERALRGWPQEELARRSGVSRAEVSAIETGRLVPSAAAALALAAALERRVEDLFQLPRPHPQPGGAAWAWMPSRTPCRYWRAEVAGRLLYYPVEASPLGIVPHDGVSRGDIFEPSGGGDPGKTLVLAGCDPAGGLLADELASSSGMRLIVI